jgi:capsular polysaccharide biosynthesis protein
VELRSYLAILRRRRLLIVVCVLLAALVSYGSTSRTPTYEASATIYVGRPDLSVDSDEAGRTTDALLSIERSILTFAIMIDSSPTAASALQRTGLGRSTESVLASATALPIPNTQLIEVVVTDSDPGTARALANGLAESFVDDVQAFEPGRQAGEGTIPALPAYVFERAQLPVTPSTPPLIRNILVAALFALVAVAGIAFLLEYLDITVKSASDAERRLGLPVLGVIPRAREQLRPAVAGG